MLENTPIDVNLNCLSDGSMEPRWIQLQNEEHELITLKIKQVVVCKDSQPCGYPVKDFFCKVDLHEKEHFLQLRYHVQGHRWNLFRIHY